MTRFSKRVVVSLLSLVVALAASCSSPETKAPTNTKKKVALIGNTASDYWQMVRKGSEKADAELDNVDVIFKLPYTGTAKDQEAVMTEVQMKDRVAAMAVSPIDPTGQKKKINDLAKSVLFITQDSDAPDSDRAAYVGVDTRAAGQQAGELVKKALPQGGKIMVFVGRAELENAKEKYEGLKAALQGSKVEIINLMTDEANPIKAEENAVEAIQKNPDLAGMVGLWSYNGPAILAAVKRAKKTGQIKIVCFDEEEDTLAGVKEGAIFATVIQSPFEIGYQSIHVMAKLLAGDKSGVPENKRILIAAQVVQQSNAQEYINKMNQLLGKAPAAPTTSPSAKAAAPAKK
jgi:ribose transport system substrate-binding protein